MTIISKGVGALGLLSNLKDIHETAKIKSNNEYAKVSSDSFISLSIGTQKANRVSYKDASRKNWLLKNNFLGSLKEPFAKVMGYLKGIGEGIINYLPNIALSLGALTFKGKKTSNIMAIGLGLLEGIDFIKNSSNLTQRTDYLK